MPEVQLKDLTSAPDDVIAAHFPIQEAGTA